MQVSVGRNYNDCYNDKLFSVILSLASLSYIAFGFTDLFSFYPFLSLSPSPFWLNCISYYSPSTTVSLTSPLPSVIHPSYFPPFGYGLFFLFLGYTSLFSPWLRTHTRTFPTSHLPLSPLGHTGVERVTWIQTGRRQGK